MKIAKVLKFHSDKCDGRMGCERACSKVHFKTDGGGERSAIRITKGANGSFDATFCNQCGLCIDLCPVQALKRGPTGIITLNKSLCVGCQACVAFCPTGVMRKAGGQIVPFKCISCGQCVKACPTGALEIVDVDIKDVEREVYARHGRVCP